MTSLLAIVLVVADAFTGDGLTWYAVAGAVLLGLLDLGATIRRREAREMPAIGYAALERAGIDPYDDKAVLVYFAESTAALAADTYAFIHERTQLSSSDVEE